MATGSLNLTPLFTCSFYRPNLRALPPTLDNAPRSLREVTPPLELVAVHSADHLVSFAHHVQQILARPVEVKELDGRRLVRILGQAVLAGTPSGTLDVYVWWRASNDKPWRLHSVSSDRTPFLDFPRTTLWIENLQDAFTQEARRRVGVNEWADRWARWAWSWIAFKVISRVDVRRLRAKVRGALDLDPSVLNLLRRRRRFFSRAEWCIVDYNLERAHRNATLLLEREAPALFPLYWALREHTVFDRSLEPKKALRDFARAMGVKPQQWKVIAESGYRGQRVYRSLCREFFVGSELNNSISYLKMVRFLQPKRLPTIEFWRQILSLCGTCHNPASKDYADTLIDYKETLRHIVRIADGRTMFREQPLPAEELHSVLGWIADCHITRLTRSQRSAGWEFLVRRAEQHRNVLRQSASTPLVWEPVLPAFEVGQLRVVPLTSAVAVWEEAIEMRHCADRYIEQCSRRDAALFSLQRHTGKRIATIAFIDNGVRWIPLELAGKANSEPTLEVRKVAGLIDDRMQSVAVRPRPEEPKPPVSSAVSFDGGLSLYEVLDREEIMHRSVNDYGSSDQRCTGE
jgi:hypothetical protein